MRFFIFLTGISLATLASANKPVLTVYAPDYFVSEWGPGPSIEEAFEKICECDVKFSAGDLVPRLILEGSSTEADIIIGLNGEYMIVKLTQELERGFEPWKKMYEKNSLILKEMGGKLIFAGPEKENDNKMMVLMEFKSPDGLKAFASNEELKAERVAAGAKLETVEVTIMGDSSFTE